MAKRKRVKEPVYRKIEIKRGDLVEVITGDDKGKRGKVVRVLRKEGKVIVEGVNVVKKHQRASREMLQGGIIDKNMPLDVSNVMRVCPHCEQRTKIKHKFVEGKWERVCAKCGQIIS